VDRRGWGLDILRSREPGVARCRIVF